MTARSQKLSRAQTNRLLLLARDRVWARNQKQTELDLFNSLAEHGLATKDWGGFLGGDLHAYSSWPIYRITPLGDEVAKTLHDQTRSASRPPEDWEVDHYALEVHRALIDTGIAADRAEEMLQQAEKSVRAWYRGYVTPEDAARKLRRGDY